MRNYAEETEKRVQFIRQAVADAHADGILFGNSGGKDSALVGILCKMAWGNGWSGSQSSAGNWTCRMWCC